MPAVTLLTDSSNAQRKMLVRRNAAGQDAPVHSLDGEQQTYRFCITAIAPVASPTDFILIQGPTVGIARVKLVKLIGAATAYGGMPVTVVRRLATGGTLGSGVLNNITVAYHDLRDGVNTTKVGYYGTANVTTVQTANGTLGANRLDFTPLTTAATSSSGRPTEWSFAPRSSKSWILKDSNDFIAINLGGGALPSGGVIDAEVEIEEETAANS